MTSTNDGKEVKSNQTNSQKGKSYYIELYKSLDTRLCGDCTGVARTQCVCEAWRRIHSLGSHSAPATHPHLLSWLQRHTASIVLQTEWTNCKDQQTLLEKAIDAFLEDCSLAISRRNGVAKYWEQQLQTRAQWFKSILPNPWGHPVLKALLDSDQTPSDEQILEWLKEERGVMFVTRLRQMAALKSCVDLALRLTTAVMQRSRLCTRRIPDTEQIESQKEPSEQASEDSFAGILSNEAGFTPEIWEFVTDLEFVLLHKATQRSSCIDLAKQVPLRISCQLVERLQNRSNISPKEKKLWKNAKEVALLIAQVVITRCMVVPTCRGAVLMALYGCSRSIVRLMTEDQLSAASVALAAPAATAHHLHTMAAAVHKQLQGERTQFTCQLYVRALTAGMNELEKLKLDKNKSADARFTEKTLSTWFKNLGTLLCKSSRLKYECILTAFSVHPSPGMFEEVKNAPYLEPIKDLQEPHHESTSEFGSWATDSRTQTNFVKTSETLNLKKTQKQANVLSTAIFSEGESLGLGLELCNDLAVLLSGPRVKTLTWDMEREALLENCRSYMKKTDFGTRALSTELKYLNLDPRSFQHLPEEDENEDDMYYGIEKGYEHLVELQEPITDAMPPEIWQNVFYESPSQSSDDSIIRRPKKERKKKKKILSSLVEDPLKLDSDVDNVACTMDAADKKINQEDKHNNDCNEDNVMTNKSINNMNVQVDIKNKRGKKEARREKKLKDTQKSSVIDTGQEPKKDIVKKTALKKFLSMKVARKNNDLRRLIANTERMMFPARTVESRDKILTSNSLGKSHVVNSIPDKSDVVFDGLFSLDDMSFQETHDEGIRLSDDSTKYKELSTQPSPTEVSSSKVTEEKEDLKKNIKKLLNFRRKNVDTTKNYAYQKDNINSLQVKLESNIKPATVIKLPSGQNIENVTRLPNVGHSNNLLPHCTMPVSDSNGSNLPNQPFKNQSSPRFVTVKGTHKTPGQKAYEEFVKSYETNLLNSSSQVQPFSSTGERQFQEFLKRYNNDCPSATNEHLQSLKRNNPSGRISEQSSLKYQISDYVASCGESEDHTHSASNNMQSTIACEPGAQRDFKEFLRELQDSINPSPTPVFEQKAETKNVTAIISPKIVKPPKKAENAPNTFSRLSYLHKNKQMENKLKPEEENKIKISPNIGSGLNSMLPMHLQRKGQIQLSRIRKKSNATDLILQGNEKGKDAMALGHQTRTDSVHVDDSKLVKRGHNDLIFKDVIKTQTSTSSMLSEKDQTELLQLLRQKSKLNLSNTVMNASPKYSLGDPVNHTTTWVNTSNIVAIPKGTMESSVVQNRNVFCKNNYTSNTGSLIGQNNHLQQPVNNLLSIEQTKTNAIIKSCSTMTHPSVQSNAFKNIEYEICKLKNTNLDTNRFETKLNYVSKKADEMNSLSSVDSILEKPTADCMKPVQLVKKTNTPCSEPQGIKSDEGWQLLNTKPQPSVKENSVPKKEFARSQKRSKSNQTKKSDKAGTKSWESVFNDLLKHKTPNRGPNALEIALQKVNVDKQILPQSSLNKTSSEKAVYLNKIDDDKQKKNNMDFSVVVGSSSKALKDKIENKKYMEIRPKENDPFISGIPNSDYDLLDELMDEDLRQEIRELSDDDTYCPTSLYTQTEKVNIGTSLQTSQVKAEAIEKQKTNNTLGMTKSVINNSTHKPTKIEQTNKSSNISYELNNKSNIINNVSINKEHKKIENSSEFPFNSHSKTEFSERIVTHTAKYNKLNSVTIAKSKSNSSVQMPSSILPTSSIQRSYNINKTHQMSFVQIPSPVLQENYLKEIIMKPISKTADNDNSVLKSTDVLTKSLKTMPLLLKSSSTPVNISATSSIAQNTVIMTANTEVKELPVSLTKETYSTNSCKPVPMPKIYPTVLGPTVIKSVIIKESNVESIKEQSKEASIAKQNLVVINKSAIVTQEHQSKTSNLNVTGIREKESFNTSALNNCKPIKENSHSSIVESVFPPDEPKILEQQQILPMYSKDISKITPNFEDNLLTQKLIERIKSKRLSLLNRTIERHISLPTIPLPYKSLNVSNTTDAINTCILKMNILKAETISNNNTCKELLKNEAVAEEDIKDDKIECPESTLINNSLSEVVSPSIITADEGETETSQLKSKCNDALSDKIISLIGSKTQVIEKINIPVITSLAKNCVSDKTTPLRETKKDEENTNKSELESTVSKDTTGYVTTQFEDFLPISEATSSVSPLVKLSNNVHDIDKDTISFVELPRKPNDDPTKRKVRIKANGTTLTATICGHLDVNIDSMFSDPEIRNIVLQNSVTKTACTINVKQKTIIEKSKSCKTIINTILSSPNVKSVDSEVIDLVSEDEEEKRDVIFKTEFGNFTSTFREHENFLKHQTKLSQKCTVNISRCELMEKIIASKFHPLSKTLDNEHQTKENNTDIIEIDNISNDSLIQMHKPLRKENILKSKLMTDFDVLRSDSIMRSLKSNDITQFNTTENEINKSQSKELKYINYTRSRKKYNALTRNIILTKNIKLKNCFIQLIRCDHNSDLLKKYKHDEVLIDKKNLFVGKKANCETDLVANNMTTNYENASNQIEAAKLITRECDEQTLIKESCNSSGMGNVKLLSNVSEEDPNHVELINQKHVETISTLTKCLVGESKGPQEETSKVPSNTNICTVKENECEYNLPHKIDQTTSIDELCKVSTQNEEKYKKIEQINSERNNALSTHEMLLYISSTSQEREIVDVVEDDSITEVCFDDVPAVLVEDNQRSPSILERRSPLSIIKDYTAHIEPVLQTFPCCAEWFVTKQGINTQYSNFYKDYKNKLMEENKNNEYNGLDIPYLIDSIHTSKKITVCDTDWFLTKSAIHDSLKPIIDLDFITSLHHNSVELIPSVGDKKSKVLSLLRMTINYIGKNSDVIDICKPAYITPNTYKYNRKRRIIKVDLTSENNLKQNLMSKKFKHMETLQNCFVSECRDDIDNENLVITNEFKEVHNKDTKLHIKKYRNKNLLLSQLNNQEFIHHEKMFYSKCELSKCAQLYPKSLSSHVKDLVSTDVATVSLQQELNMSNGKIYDTNTSHDSGFKRKDYDVLVKKIKESFEYDSVYQNKNNEDLPKKIVKTDLVNLENSSEGNDNHYSQKKCKDNGTRKFSNIPVGKPTGLNKHKRDFCAEPSDVTNDKVTLLYKADDSDIILKGSMYKDPIIGTCYLFPINRSIKSNIKAVSDVRVESTGGEMNQDNLNVLIPKITYSKQGLCTDLYFKTKRNLKRKFESFDYKYSREKRYRKGKNINYPKNPSDKKFAYVKEFKALFEYWESIKFSFSRPFHKEDWDVNKLHKFWPIQGTIDLHTDKSDENIALFTYQEEPHCENDPLRQSLAEEIASEYSETEYKSIDINETNFSMGFGEGSDRVIQQYGDQNTLQETSAATLSDVKPQPFSGSEYYSNNLKNTVNFQTHKDDLEVTKRFLNYIKQKNKVRSFFKKTNVELNLEWMSCNVKENDMKCHQYSDGNYACELQNLDFFTVPSTETIVQVVQVGQLPVSAAAQNPVTCDPRVTQVTDASPPQCSAENSPRDGSQPSVKTEYTELTTADLSLPLVEEYERQNNQTISLLSQSENNKLVFSDENIPIEKEINSIVKIEIAEEAQENEEEMDNEDSELQKIISHHTNNREFCFTNDSSVSESQALSFENLNDTDTFLQNEERNEKTDQIAHAMSAAGITTNAEQLPRNESQGNVRRDKINEETSSIPLTTSTNFPKATSINAISLQQALAQILPPPLNRTNNSDTKQTSNPQILHLVQGKNSNTVNQLTLMDNNHQTVLNASNSTPVLHIVQNKGQANTNNNNTGQLTNSFNGLPLVDSNNIQQGSSQLLHIVNTSGQKTNNTGQLLKRVNLLTNISNVQSGNEQKMVQFVCKSADGKSIQLNTAHQRSMVLRIQPIESSNVQNTKPVESHNDVSANGNALNANSVNENLSSQQEIKSRSVYEENYAKFIQNSGKSTVTEKSTSLPKFNQAFGKQVYQEENQKVSITENHSHLTATSSANEVSESQNDNAISLDQIGHLNNPPLLLRKATSQSTSQTQSTQPSLVTQLKQTVTPMNLQTMHSGVIYTRQIPVNIGGGQTINLITVPSTELMDDSSQKQHSNSSDVEPSIIKIVPQNSTTTSDVALDEGRSQATTDTSNSQPQPVLTQMRIKLPMLSKPSQMVSGTRVVRPSFFQIQRNVIGGANQPVYQQLVLTAAPPLGQQTIRLPQSQTNRIIKVPTENQTTSESQMSSSTLEQLREFDMVLEQVKERSTVQPNQSNSSNSFNKVHTSGTDATDTSSHSTSSTESSHQVLYTIGNNSSLNVAYVNRKPTVNPPTVTSYVRSPDSSNVNDSPSSSTQNQVSHTVTTESQQTNELSSSQNQHKVSKITSKAKTRPKPNPNPTSSVKINTVPPKPSTQKPFEDEQTTQRILYILAEYKEQVENSPDKDKPAPRRRSNPPSNPGSSKRKKSSSSSRRPGTRDISPVHGEDTCRTMGSEDSSCGTSQGDCTESCLDSHSPQDSPRKVVRKLSFEPETPAVQPRPQPQRNVIVADGQTITVARNNTGKPTTAVLMPANYILPVSMVKSGQQIAIVTNRGPKILTVGGGEGGGNTVLLQRLIGPGLKPVLTRPGVRHVRLPAAAIQNLQAFTLGSTTGQQPDSTASVVHANPPELIDTRATSSPWAERDGQDPKPEKQSSPPSTEPWNLGPHEPHDYSYEEIVRSDNMDRTVLDAIPDRYSPDMEAQRIFDKMFDIDSKRSYIDSQDDSPRCGYDIDASECDDKPFHQVVHRKDGTTQRHHRLAHVSSAALRHRYAILEHELRLQKSLSEECEDLGVDSPSAAELFPEAELLFSSSPAHEAPHHSHTPQPIINQGTIPQPDIDDQIATDQLISHNDAPDDEDLNMALGLDNIVTVSGDGTITLDPQEFARSHPNTTFHKEPTDESELQPFTIANVKGRHMTSTIFHASRAPATVLVTAPQTTVISQAAPDGGIQNNLKYSDTPSNSQQGSIPSVLVKDNGVSKFDSMLNRELHLSNTASTIIHSGATQVIRRVCYDDDKHEPKFLESHALMGEDAKMAEDSRDATLESMADVDDDRSSPDRNEMFWESNSTSERSEGRRPLDFSSDSDKCCKSPFEETNSTDSSGIGTHIMRLDSVIKDARGIERSGSADGSSAEDTHPPLRTYPPKRYHPPEAEERSTSGKTRAGERSPDMESRRRASNRGVVKRGCHCCNGSPAPSKPKKSRPRKPTAEFTT